MPDWVGVVLVLLYFGSMLIAFAPMRKHGAKRGKAPGGDPWAAIAQRYPPLWIPEGKPLTANPWEGKGDRVIPLQVNGRDILIVETDILLPKADLKRLSDDFEAAISRGETHTLLLSPGMYLSGIIHADGRVEKVDRLRQALGRDAAIVGIDVAAGSSMTVGGEGDD